MTEAISTAGAADTTTMVRDDRLMARCAHRDEAAWTELVSRYERLVWKVARGEGLSSEDAADACQSVFETLLASIDDIDDPERLSSWLMTVTRRTAWRLRNQGRREIPVEAAGGDDDGHEVELERLTGALWLHDAINELGEPCRSLLVALYLEAGASSYASVALRLGRPIGSIGPTRARCLERLRTMLDTPAGSDA